MEAFAFEPAGDPQTAPEPMVEISLTFRGHTATVRALYDTGSDISHLSNSWAQFFNVDPALVPKIPVGMLGGHQVSGSLVFVTARLDGHEFIMPVVFHTAQTKDLFGRHGIGELYGVTLDAVAQLTRAEWKHDAETAGDRMKHDVLAIEGNFLPGWDAET